MKNRKPTLYIVQEYNSSGEMVSLLVFPIHLTNKNILNQDHDIWLGRHSKRNGRAYMIKPYYLG